MNFRSNYSFTLTTLFVTALAAGCIAEHRYDDDGWEEGTWDPNTGTCVCSDPNNSGGNNNGGNNNGGGDTCSTDPDTIYLSHDTAICETVQFSCPEDHDLFNDSCGCGCVAKPAAPTCPEEGNASALYLSRDAKVCTILNVSCGDGRDAFISPCGCGCVDAVMPDPPPPPPSCPDPNDPKVLYVNSDAAVCAAIDFTCPTNCSRFDSTCGCGCIEQ